jgi:hypothetical protein
MTFPSSLLIINKLSVEKGVHYAIKQLETDTPGETGTTTRWETTKTVDDPEERKRGINLVERLNTHIRKTTEGVKCSFGIVAPMKAEEVLDEVNSYVKREVNEFNATARFTHIEFRPMVVKLASDDERAMKAMSEQITGTLDELQSAMDKFDIKNVRAVVSKLVGFDKIIPNGRGKAITDLIKTVRKQASAFIKSAGEKVNDMEAAKAQIDASVVDRARFAVFAAPGETVDTASLGLKTVDAGRFAPITSPVASPAPEPEPIEEEPEAEPIPEPAVMASAPAADDVAAFII